MTVSGINCSVCQRFVKRHVQYIVGKNLKRILWFLKKQGQIVTNCRSSLYHQLLNTNIKTLTQPSQIWKVFISAKSFLKVKNDHCSKFSNLSNWKEEAWKKSGLQRDSNRWPPHYRCVALPTELWSHTLGARSIYLLSSTTAVQKWIISYILHKIIFVF